MTHSHHFIGASSRLKAAIFALPLAALLLARPVGSLRRMRAQPPYRQSCARSMANSADYFPPPDSQGGWRALQDAASIRRLAGMDLSRLERAFDFTQRCSQNGGLLVVRHGYLVFERYFGRAHRGSNPDMASTGKAYTSIACGIML